MISFICLLVGLILGITICYILYSSKITLMENLINDYKKSIKLHNSREIKLICLNQYTYNYINEQTNLIKKKLSKIETKKVSIDEALLVGSYATLNKINKVIKSKEKEIEDLHIKG